VQEPRSFSTHQPGGRKRRPSRPKRSELSGRGTCTPKKGKKEPKKDCSNQTIEPVTRDHKADTAKLKSAAQGEEPSTTAATKRMTRNGNKM